jgi:putative restriction endonuclease
MKFYVGVTDNKWFEFLASRTPDEVNFWRPGGTGMFQVIPPGAPFLFKLHSPHNYIVGGGYFVKHSNIPLSLAWEAFREKNGAASLDAVRALILKFRTGRPPEHDPVIGCTVLASPFFFGPQDWLPAPENWAASIVQGKTYDTQEVIGARIWNEIELRIAKAKPSLTLAGGASIQSESSPRYGAEFLTRARLGQGAFRILVTDAYTRRCAITGERTLPALEAAHIQPFAKSGPNVTANGLLLRSDLHKLFDAGYLSLTPELNVEVSRKIKEEFENGREYYVLHGRKLSVLPTLGSDRPSSEYLQWHNAHVYLG